MIAWVFSIVFDFCEAVLNTLIEESLAEKYCSFFPFSFPAVENRGE